MIPHFDICKWGNWGRGRLKKDFKSDTSKNYENKSVVLTHSLLLQVKKALFCLFLRTNGFLILLILTLASGFLALESLAVTTSISVMRLLWNPGGATAATTETNTPGRIFTWFCSHWLHIFKVFSPGTLVRDILSKLQLKFLSNPTCPAIRVYKGARPVS